MCFFLLSMVCFVVGIIFVGYPDMESWMPLVGWGTLALGVAFLCLFISTMNKAASRNDCSQSMDHEQVEQKKEQVIYNKDLLHHEERQAANPSVRYIPVDYERLNAVNQAELAASRTSRLRERDEAVRLHAAYIKERQEHPDTFPGRKQYKR